MQPLPSGSIAGEEPEPDGLNPADNDELAGMTHAAEGAIIPWPPGALPASLGRGYGKDGTELA